jgi:DNA topoisomerase-1
MSSLTTRAFCPTGPGGGVDNSCPPKHGGGNADAAQAAKDEAKRKVRELTKDLTREEMLNAVAKAENTPEKLFDLSQPGTKFVNIGELNPIRAREKGIDTATRIMYAGGTDQSPMPPRVPISVKKTGPTYEIQDGNSTYAVLKAAGWERVPVVDVDLQTKSAMLTLVKAGQTLAKMRIRHTARRKVREVSGKVHLRQYDATVVKLEGVLHPFFLAQAKDVSDRLLRLERGSDVIGEKAWCPTGPGGGKDNSCSPNGGKSIPSVTLPDEVDKNLESFGLSGPLGGIWKQVLESNGVDPAAIQEMEQLFDSHRHGDGIQERADKEIADALHTDTPLGNALRTQVAVETAVLAKYEKLRPVLADRQDARSKADMKEAWEHGYAPKNDDAYGSWEEQWEVEEKHETRELREPMRFYRKGSLDKDVVATSTNSSGARSHAVIGDPSSQPHFKPTGSWTSAELKAEGYMVLGGVGFKGMGYSGENEVTWIRVRESSVTNTKSASRTKAQQTHSNTDAEALAHSVYDPREWDALLVETLMVPYAEAYLEAASAEVELAKMAADIKQVSIAGSKMVQAYEQWKAFNPNQPRDEAGRFASTGSGGMGRVERGADTPDKKALVDQLAVMRDMIEKNFKQEGWKHGSIQGMVIEEGQWDNPQPLPKGVRRGTMKQCFQNAYQLATRDSEYTYVEGYAMTKGIPLAIEHAWVVDKAGNVVDNTWDTPGTAYLGIHFDTSFVEQQAAKTGVYGVLGGYHMEATRELLENGLPSGARTKSAGMFIRTKASTAARWIGAKVLKYDEMTVRTSAGEFSFKISTEYPKWMKRRLKELLEETFSQDYWQDINDTTSSDITSVLQRGLKDGWSITDIAQEIVDSLPGGQGDTLSRATAIARTEAGHALNGARSAAIDDLAEEMLPYGLPIKKTWMSVLGTTTRETHADADGVPADQRGMWSIGGYDCRWPGDVMLPAHERINCFPGSVLVSGDFTGAQMGRYDGIVAKIILSTGVVLTVTPHHPIMTSKGWVSAGCLQKGDKVACYRTDSNLALGKAAGVPTSGIWKYGGEDVDYKPVSIEQVSKAIFSAGATSGVIEILRAEMNDFYGDGVFFDAEVQVVRADWKLLIDRIIEGPKKIGDFVFTLVDPQSSGVPCLSSSYIRLDRVPVAAPGLPSLAKPFLCIPISSISPSGSLALGIAPDRHTAFLEIGGDAISGYPVSLRQSLQRDTVGVLGEESIGYFRRDLQSSRAVPSTSFDHNAAALDSAFDGGGIAVVDSGNGEHRFPSEVSFADVVSVEEFPFHGVVYDLQGVNGLIVARDPESASIGIGVIASNCQCTILSEYGMTDSEAGELLSDYRARVEEREQFYRSQGKSYTDDKSCGAGSAGSPGFGTGNTCAVGRGGQSLLATKKRRDGTRVLANGKPLPDHVPVIPPAWEDVHVSLDKNSDLVVKGRDAKGRIQSIYSEKHSTRQAKLKFAKVKELRAKQKAIRKEIESDLKSDDPEVRESAAVARLIQETGIRPGGSNDGKAAVQSYGATTLEARHISVRDGKVTLKFVGKKGVKLSIPVEDKAVAKDLIRRKAEAGGPRRPIFDTTDERLREYADTLDGGKFNPKDFRTAKGTEIAVAMIKSMPAPKTEREYKASAKAVARAVSDRLGNTPTVALQSYIDPVVFSKWRIK